jgi:hypothetical protein
MSFRYVLLLLPIGSIVTGGCSPGSNESMLQAPNPNPSDVVKTATLKKNVRGPKDPTQRKPLNPMGGVRNDL